MKNIILYYDPKTNKIFEGIYYVPSRYKGKLNYCLIHKNKVFKLNLKTWIPKHFVMLGRLD